MTAPGPITDTPLFDGVLGERLEAARRAVHRAEQDARDFRAALSAGAAAALEQQAEQRAQALVAERTAVLAARTSGLESRLRRTEDLLATRDRELAELRSAPEVVAEAPVVVAEAPVVVAEAPEVVEPPAASEPAPGRVTVARQARRGDDGPAAADVPSVPSMKDIFASTRAAGWLSDLRASKRPV